MVAVNVTTSIGGSIYLVVDGMAYYCIKGNV